MCAHCTLIPQDERFGLNSMHMTNALSYTPSSRCDIPQALLRQAQLKVAAGGATPEPEGEQTWGRREQSGRMVQLELEGYMECDKQK